MGFAIDTVVRVLPDNFRGLDYASNIGTVTGSEDDDLVRVRMWSGDEQRFLAHELENIVDLPAYLEAQFEDHLRGIASAVIDVFEDLDEDTLAGDIMQDVFKAIGLTEIYGA